MEGVTEMSSNQKKSHLKKKQNSYSTSDKEIRGKKIMVMGLGRTGFSLSRFLVSKGAKVTISDHKSKAELTNVLEKVQEFDSQNKIQYDLGGHSPKLFLQQDCIIRSPGISPYLKLFDYAEEHGVKVTGELEFISAFIKDPIIAITGTNGKTTVCRLIYEFLKASNVTAWKGGNYGKPLSDYLIANKKHQVLVTEVSSFQLEYVEKFSPQHIVFTNLSENHLDRYQSQEDYINAKRRIFLNTNSSTTSILNADENDIIEIARNPAVQRGRIFYFSRNPGLETQVMNIGGAISLKDSIRVRTGPDKTESFSTRNMKLLGDHSRENIMAAILASLKHGATHEAIQSVIDTFPGLPHRLEYVRKVGGVKFYNDSKATNVKAVKRALEAFEGNLILIMGGKETQSDFTSLRELIKLKVKTLILVGESKEKINRDVGDESETFLIGTFEEAIVIAFQKSRIGDTVLLSPGCSSFDIFYNYEERGNYFKEIVRQFK